MLRTIRKIFYYLTACIRNLYNRGQKRAENTDQVVYMDLRLPAYVKSVVRESSQQEPKKERVPVMRGENLMGSIQYPCGFFSSSRRSKCLGFFSGFPHDFLRRYWQIYKMRQQLKRDLGDPNRMSDSLVHVRQCLS